MHANNKISLRICPIAFYCGIIIACHTGFDAEVRAHDDLICAICIPLIIGKWQFPVPPEYDSDNSSGNSEAIEMFPGLDACFPGSLSRMANAKDNFSVINEG